MHAVRNKLPSFFFCIVTTMSLGSPLGHEVGGNGDAVSAWFVNRAREIVSFITTKKLDHVIWAQDIDTNALTMALDTAVILLDDTNRASLEREFGQLDENQVAHARENGVSTPVIIIDRETWTNFFHNNTFDSRTILHLYLEASGQNDAHSKISARVPFSESMLPAEAPLRELANLTGNFMAPVALPDGGFALIRRTAVNTDTMTADAVERYTAKAEQVWQVIPTIPTDYRHEHASFALQSLTPSSDGGFVTVGLMQTGLCRMPFLQKITASGSLLHVVSLGGVAKNEPDNDCWDRIYGMPLRVIELQQDRFVVLFEHRIVIVEKQQVIDISSRLSEFSSDTTGCAYASPGNLNFQDIIPTADHGLIAIGGKNLAGSCAENEVSFVPFIIKLNASLVETEAKLLPSYQRSFFSAAVSITNDRFLLFLTTMRDTQAHYAYQQAVVILSFSTGAMTSLTEAPFLELPQPEADHSSFFINDLIHTFGDSALASFTTATYDSASDLDHSRSTKMLPPGRVDPYMANAEVMRRMTSFVAAIVKIDKNGQITSRRFFPESSILSALILAHGPVLIIHHDRCRLVENLWVRLI